MNDQDFFEPSHIAQTSANRQGIRAASSVVGGTAIAYLMESLTIGLIFGGLPIGLLAYQVYNESKSWNYEEANRKALDQILTYIKNRQNDIKMGMLDCWDNET